MAVKTPESVTVQDLLQDRDELEVEARCQRCGRTFGEVVFWEGESPLTPGLNLWEAGQHGRVVTAGGLSEYRDKGQTRAQARGPRTGSRIEDESWALDGDVRHKVRYFRKICKCGDDRKWSQAKLAIQPVRMEPSGPTVYL